MNSKVLICVVLASIVGSCIAATCSKPEIKSTSFTTQDATIVSQIAFITEFELKCSNAGGENLPLFAEVNGRLSPVARTGSGKYQVSWNEETKKASRGDHTVRLYDEDGYAAVRKAQRSGDRIDSVKPFATVTVNFPGAYKGPYVNSELLAVGLVGVAAYVALTTKNKINA